MTLEVQILTQWTVVFFNSDGFILGFFAVRLRNGQRFALQGRFDGTAVLEANDGMLIGTLATADKLDLSKLFKVGVDGLFGNCCGNKDQLGTWYTLNQEFSNSRFSNPVRYTLEV